MSDLLEEMTDSRDKENVQMKSGEITGDVHMFHSLPKEFQLWHTTYYILEKVGNLDINTIPKAQLNAYMWKIVMNASFYGIATFMLIFHVILVERFIDNALITFLDFMFFGAGAIYIAYQFSFFGVIRAQIIGPLTELAAENTSFMYYKTFAGVLFSVLIMVIFTLLVGESILELIFRLLVITSVKYGNNMPHITEILFQIGINIHNFIVVLIYQHKGFIDNVYFMLIALTSIQTIAILIVEYLFYKKTRKEIVYEISKDNLEKKYPIEKSQQVITAWRSKHNV